MVGIALFIPVFAQTLIATILHGPHGVLLRLIYIQHLTAILSLINIQHLTTADSSPALRVILIADSFHLQHVFTTDALVAALIEKYRGIVAIIDNGITHQCRALLPAGTLHILLGITGGHGLRQSHAVTTLYILLTGRHMHPTHHIRPTLHHQSVRVIAEPSWHTNTDARPFIRGALGVSVYHHHTIVQPYFTFGKACFAESCAGSDAVGCFAVDNKPRLHHIQIPIPPRPEVKAFDSLLSRDRTCFARLHGHRLTVETSHLTSVCIHHPHGKSKSSRRYILVLHLALCMNHSLMSCHIYIRSVDVGSRGAEVRIKWQCLVEFARDMQPHVFGQTAVVGIEVIVVPLITTVQHPIAVLPIVVATHGYHVLAFLDIRCDVEAKGHHAIIREAHFLSVHPYVGTLTGTLELNE